MEGGEGHTNNNHEEEEGMEDEEGVRDGVGIEEVAQEEGTGIEGGGGLELFMEATGCDEEEAARFMEQHGFRVDVDVAQAVDAYFNIHEIDREQRKLYEEEMAMEQMEMDTPPSASRGRPQTLNGNGRDNDITVNDDDEDNRDGGGDDDEARERRRRRGRRQRAEANSSDPLTASTGAMGWGRRVLSRVKRVLAGDGGPSNTAWLMKMQDAMGLGHPAFLDCSFRQALGRSSRDERLLVIYLHSEHHELSESFCHRVWYDPFILDYFTDASGGGGAGERAPLLWAGDVRTSEAYHLFSSLRGSTFPLVACMVGEGSGARLVRAIEGEMACDIVKLARMLEECAEGVAAQAVVRRQDRDEYQRARELREEQDEEYERSLAEDIARAERRREEERLERERAEEEAAREAQLLERQRSVEERRASKEREIFTRRESAGNLLQPEPESGSQGVTTIRINLPNGVKQMRRFGPNATLRSVFDWVASLEDCTFIEFNLVSNFPRVTYTDARKDETLAEAGLSPQSALFVEVQDDDEDDCLLEHEQQ